MIKIIIVNNKKVCVWLVFEKITTSKTSSNFK